MIKQKTSKVKFKIGTAKVRKMFLGTLKVYSSGSIVSYYDGNTLIGTEEVEEGQDVLHPSFSTAKTGYTLYGWTPIQGTTERATTLVATGEPMTVYAIYVPNVLTVVSATLEGSTYSLAVLNSNYVSGGTSVGANVWYREGTDDNTAGFTLDKKMYQTASITVKQTNYESDGWSRAYYDGSQFSGTTGGSIGSGSHSIRAVTHSDRSGGGWAWCYVGVISLTLSNPTAWV